MRYIRAALFPALLLSGFISPAQVTDSLRAYLRHKPGITGDLGSVQSFFYGFKAPIAYVSAGLTFADHLEFGIGYCRLKVPPFDGNKLEDQVPFYHNVFLSDPLGVPDTVPARLRFEYLMLYGEYVFYKTKHWSFSVPLRFGFGRTRYDYNYNDISGIAEKHFMFVYHPSVSFDYTIFRWLGFNTDLGYKFTLSGFKNIRHNFNSPVYNIGFFLYYSEIYKMLFPHSRLAGRL